MTYASSTCLYNSPTTTCDYIINFPIGDVIFGIGFMIFLISFLVFGTFFNTFKQI